MKINRNRFDTGKFFEVSMKALGLESAATHCKRLHRTRPGRSYPRPGAAAFCLYAGRAHRRQRRNVLEILLKVAESTKPAEWWLRQSWDSGKIFIGFRGDYFFLGYNSQYRWNFSRISCPRKQCCLTSLAIKWLRRSSVFDVLSASWPSAIRNAKSNFSRPGSGAQSFEFKFDI